MRPSLAALAVTVALGLGACGTRDPDTRPFAMHATRADGSELNAMIGETGEMVFAGRGRRVDDTTLVVEGASSATAGALGDVTLRFRNDAARDVVFPAQLDTVDLTVVLVASAQEVGPRGEPLPVNALGVATGAETDLRTQFILAEAAYAAGSIGTFTIGPVGDVPSFRVIPDWAEFDPAECGPAYYDFLQVAGGESVFTLRRGERRQLVLGEGEPPWKVLHVLSWHRRGTCDGQAEAWTQLAAWR
jgi:hypothetical protein